MVDFLTRSTSFKIDLQLWQRLGFVCVVTVVFEPVLEECEDVPGEDGELLPDELEVELPEFEPAKMSF